MFVAFMLLLLCKSEVAAKGGSSKKNRLRKQHAKRGHSDSDVQHWSQGPAPPRASGAAPFGWSSGQWQEPRIPPSSSIGIIDYNIGVGAPMDELPMLNAGILQSINSSSSYTPGTELNAQIRENGFAQVRSLLSPAEMKQFRPHVIYTTLELAYKCETYCVDKDDPLDEQCRGCERTQSTPASLPKSFVKVRNLHRQDPAVARLVKSPRIAALAAQALGTKAVRFYQDTAFFKEPGDKQSSWHQDSAAAPLDTNRFVTIWLALDPWGARSEQGSLVFAAKSHRSKKPPSLRKLPLSERILSMRSWTDQDMKDAGWRLSGTAFQPTFRYKHNDAAAAGFEQGMMGPGDASIHLGWTFHRAAPNLAKLPRCALAVTYFADGAKFYSDVLHLGAVSETVRGVEFALEDGTHIVVQLLSDDIGTWVPWLLNREMIPGTVAKPSGAPLVAVTG